MLKRDRRGSGVRAFRIRGTALRPRLIDQRLQACVTGFFAIAAGDDRSSNPPVGPTLFHLVDCHSQKSGLGLGGMERMNLLNVAHAIALRTSNRFTPIRACGKNSQMPYQPRTSKPNPTAAAMIAPGPTPTRRCSSVVWTFGRLVRRQR